MKKQTRSKEIEVRKSPADLVVAASMVLSIVALVVSVRGCQISQQALSMSEQDFTGARSLVYAAKLSKKNDEISLSPVDSALRPQKAEIYFPTQLDEAIWNVEPPDYSISLIILRSKLEKVLEQRFPRKDGYVQVVDQASVPLIIDTVYVAKGESLHEKSMYELMYRAIISDEAYKKPSVTFKGIAFLKRLPVEQDPKETLRLLWQSGFSEQPPVGQ